MNGFLHRELVGLWWEKCLLGGNLGEDQGNRLCKKPWQYLNKACQYKSIYLFMPLWIAVIGSWMFVARMPISALKMVKT